MKSQIVNSGSRRAFTLVELLVAVAIMAIVLGAMGVIFRMSMEAYRASSATAEIMRKLRAVTEQLDSDFNGMRKSDGMVFVVWKVSEDLFYTDYTTNPDARYRREDRIVFFANGDFQSYRDQTSASPTGPKQVQVRGNVARVSYMLARDAAGFWPEDFSDPTDPAPINKRALQRPQRDQRRRTRILARSQHIVTADADFAPLPPSPIAFPDFSNINGPSGINTLANAQTYSTRNNTYEYDIDGIAGWRNANIEPAPPKIGDVGYQAGLVAMLSVCAGIPIINETGGAIVTDNGIIDTGGLQVDPDRPDLVTGGVHQMLIEGARDFKIQGWLESQRRWYPETGTVTDPATGAVAGSDFFLNVATGAIATVGAAGGAMYAYYPASWLPPKKMLPHVPVGAVVPGYPAAGGVTGLGKAVKFTFTLYDSRGFFRNGLTFTHIVYLGDN